MNRFRHQIDRVPYWLRHQNWECTVVCFKTVYSIPVMGVPLVCGFINCIYWERILNLHSCHKQDIWVRCNTDEKFFILCLIFWVVIMICLGLITNWTPKDMLLHSLPKTKLYVGSVHYVPGCFNTAHGTRCLLDINLCCSMKCCIIEYVCIEYICILCTWMWCNIFMDRARCYALYLVAWLTILRLKH